MLGHGRHTTLQLNRCVPTRLAPGKGGDAYPVQRAVHVGGVMSVGRR
jgi:hypothetical protein